LTQPIDLAIAPLSQMNNPTAAQRIEKLHTVWNSAREALGVAQQRQAHYANQHRTDVKFKVGDQVLLSTENLQFIRADRRTPKLESKFIGPFYVKQVANDNAYVLDLPQQLQSLHSTFNISRFKVYRDGSQLFPDRPVPESRPPPEALSDNGAPLYEVDKIVAKRGRGVGTRYLVKWVGYPMWEATWEPKENLGGAAEALAEFNQRERGNVSA
jgi:hypothetical protein